MGVGDDVDLIAAAPLEEERYHACDKDETVGVLLTSEQ